MGWEKSCNKNRESLKALIRRDKNFNTRQQNATNRKRVLCDSTGHKINDCTEVKDSVKRRQIVSSKNLYFNCLKNSHCGADCQNCTCFKSKRKHHESLCVNNQLYKKTPATEIKRQKEVSLGEKSICYPILIVNTNGIQRTDLVDTGAGSSNAPAALINHIVTSLVRRETKQMEILLRNTLRKIEVRNFTISNQYGFFKLNVGIHKV